MIPGGESTTLWKFFELAPWEEAIARFAATGRPILGTCAGAIVLAREVDQPAPEGLGLIDITVERNAYGRQVDSFVGTVEAPALGGNLPGGLHPRAADPRRRPGRRGSRDARTAEPVLGAAGQRRRGDLPSRADADDRVAASRLRERGGGRRKARRREPLMSLVPGKNAATASSS